MDILKLIKDKVKLYDDFPELNGIRAIITHLEVAEKYLLLAKDSDSEHFYTDIIYRTNHIFEGILKEAYLSIEGKDNSKKKPYEIEKYLIDNSLLKERVMDIFINYRQNWRNPSTHDYKLFFTEQESFLAIVTVSAFVNILLDQIVESISFRKEKDIIQEKRNEIIDSIDNYKNLNFKDKIIKLVLSFFNEIKKSKIKSESHFIGILSGYINSIEPSFNILIDDKLAIGRQLYYIDLIIEYNNERILFEIKKGRLFKESELGKINDQNAVERLISYMKITKTDTSILIFTPVNDNDSIVMSPHFLENDKYSIFEFKQNQIDSI